MTLHAWIITMRGRIREALCPELQELRDQNATLLENASIEVRRLRAEALKLEAERDEARAEVERLRADAERWRYFVTHCQWFRHHDEDGSYSTMSTRLPYDADQSCVATRNAAIDAALKVPK